MSKHFLVILVALSLCGCVTIPKRVTLPLPPKAKFVEVSKFCKKNGLTYSYNTLDDVVELTSKDKDIRLLLNSLLVYYNGRFFRLKSSPFYREGRIFIPQELEDIILKKIPKIFVPLAIKRIVIDPGHGGKDPGAISPKGTKEKDINLRIAKLLKRELEKKGFIVYLTRKKDIYLSLQKRVEIAKDKRADLFISIHANSNRNPKVNGVEVYYLSPKYFNWKKRLLWLSNYLPPDLRGTYSPRQREIIWKNICVKNDTISRQAAHCLVTIFRELGFKVRYPKGAPFYVLRYGYVPSILVEVGYLSNTREERLLKNPRYQHQIACAIALGVSSLNRQYPRLVKRYGNR